MLFMSVLISTVILETNPPTKSVKCSSMYCFTMCFCFSAAVASSTPSAPTCGTGCVCDAALGFAPMTCGADDELGFALPAGFPTNGPPPTSPTTDLRGFECKRRPVSIQCATTMADGAAVAIRVSRCECTTRARPDP